LQGVSADAADAGMLALINLVLSSPDFGDDADVSGSFASNHSQLISISLAAACSCQENPLLISAISDLLRIPVVTQCLSFSSSAGKATVNPGLPPLQNLSIAEIMAHPITR
jgi:hypothetical protein